MYVERYNISGRRRDNKESGASEPYDADQRRSGGFLNCSGGFLILFHTAIGIKDLATNENQDRLQHRGDSTK